MSERTERCDHCQGARLPQPNPWVLEQMATLYREQRAATAKGDTDE